MGLEDDPFHLTWRELAVKLPGGKEVQRKIVTGSIVGCFVTYVGDLYPHLHSNLFLYHGGPLNIDT